MFSSAKTRCSATLRCEECPVASPSRWNLQAAKLGRASPAQTTLSVGHNATQVLVTDYPNIFFEGNDSPTVVFTVAEVSAPESGMSNSSALLTART